MIRTRDLSRPEPSFGAMGFASTNDCVSFVPQKSEKIRSIAPRAYRAAQDDYIFLEGNAGEKQREHKGRTLKDSFQNTVYLERGMPYFAFVSTKAVLVSKIDKS